MGEPGALSEEGVVGGKGDLVLGARVDGVSVEAVDAIELATEGIFGDEVESAMGCFEEGKGALFVGFFVDELFVSTGEVVARVQTRGAHAVRSEVVGVGRDDGDLGYVARFPESATTVIFAAEFLDIGICRVGDPPNGVEGRIEIVGFVGCCFAVCLSVAPFELGFGREGDLDVLVLARDEARNAHPVLCGGQLAGHGVMELLDGGGVYEVTVVRAFRT